jgi:hypothetical protein
MYEQANLESYVNLQKNLICKTSVLFVSGDLTMYPISGGHRAFSILYKTNCFHLLNTVDRHCESKLWSIVATFCSLISNRREAPFSQIK